MSINNDIENIFFNLTDDAFILADAADGKILQLNRSSIIVLDKNESELRSSSIFAEFPCIDRKSLENSDSKAAKFTHKILLKSGAYKYLEINITKVQHNNSLNYAVILKDITKETIAGQLTKYHSIWFDVLFDRTPLSIMIVNSERIILNVNPAFCELTGYLKNEIVGQSTRLIHVNEKTFSDFAIEKYDRIFKGEQVRVVYQMRKKSGELFWMETMGQALEPNSNSFDTVWQIMDITEKQNSLAALLESEERFRTITEQMLDAVFLLNNDGVCTYLSPAAGNLFSIPKEDILNQPVASFIAADEVEGFLTALKDIVVNNSKLSNFKITIHTRDNKIFYGEVNASKYTTDSFTGVLGILHDVTERTKTEITLQKLKTGIEQSSAIIVITDYFGNIEYVNSKFVSITGYTYEEAIGQNPRILKSGETKPEVYHEMWQTITAGKEWSGEILNKKKNGETFWEKILISPIFNDKGQIINFIGIKDDISERKKMVADLITSKEKAEEMNRLKSSFLANMSHELRTPMIGILGYSGILKDLLMENDLKHMAETIHISGTRLLETLNLILDISTLEAGKLEATFVNIDLNSVIIESIEKNKTLAEKKGLILDDSSLFSGLFVKGDRRLLCDIFNNLLNNAVKFTDSGSVSISSKFNNVNNTIEIAVKDTGIGIPPERHKDVFDDFRQVSEGFNRVYEGMGLGLTITKKFVEKLGGSISLESFHGQGSTFTVTLPFSAALNTTINAKSITDSFEDIESKILTKKPLNILLVENDKTNQEVISSYISDYHNLQFADDGYLAIELAKENHFDLILMDINLGSGLSGLDVTKTLRKFSEYKTTPIIAITAYAMKGDKERFIESGCSNYLSKPFSRKDLFNMISNYN